MENTPPQAKIIPKEYLEHGQKRNDSYYWMRSIDLPEVKEYLRSENVYTEAIMAPTQGLQKQLFEEIKSRIKESDSSAPARRGDYEYYSRTEEGKAYRIYCRKKTGGNEEVLLDGNIF